MRGLFGGRVLPAQYCPCESDSLLESDSIESIFSGVPFLKQLLLRNCEVDFIEICNVYGGKMIIKATKNIFNSDKICSSYSDLNFGITFLEHGV